MLVEMMTETIPSTSIKQVVDRWWARPCQLDDVTETYSLKTLEDLQ